MMYPLANPAKNHLSFNEKYTGVEALFFKLLILFVSLHTIHKLVIVTL